MKLTLRSSALAAFIACLLCLAGTSCPRGETEVITKYDQEMPTDLPADDKLEDKDPAFEAWMTAMREFNGQSVYYNASPAVLSLDIAKAETEYEASLLGKLYPNFRAALADTRVLTSIDMIDRFTKQRDDAVYGGIETAMHRGDSIYPGGKQGMLGALLARLNALPESPQQQLASAFIAAALELGGDEPEGLSKGANGLKEEILRSFEASAVLSKPLGFYTESETLRQVFRRDRLLQQPFGMSEMPGISGKEPDVELLAMALCAQELKTDPALLAAYTKYQQLAEKITNPTSNLDLRDVLAVSGNYERPMILRELLKSSPAWRTKVVERNASKAGIAFWPFSYSKESVLASRMDPEELEAKGLMTALIERIQNGSLSLEPLPDSGWYDYQAHALETLLLPERAHESDKLLLGGAYKKRLRSAFEAMITQRRETHIKQLEIGMEATAMPPMQNKPELSMEPALTNYLRTARGYAMLQQSLGEIIGEGNLGSRMADGMAARPIMLSDGTLSVWQALDESRMIFCGLELLGCSELGLASAVQPAELDALEPLVDSQLELESLRASYPVIKDPRFSERQQLVAAYCIQKAYAWLSAYPSSEVLAGDPRVIVPVSANPENGNLRCWAVLGVKFLKLGAHYAVPPRVAPAGRGAAELSEAEAEALLGGDSGAMGMAWDESRYYIPVYDYAEVVIGPAPLTREEFRAICDKHTKRADIIAELAALGE